MYSSSLNEVFSMQQSKKHFPQNWNLKTPEETYLHQPQSCASQAVAYKQITPQIMKKAVFSWRF